MSRKKRPFTRKQRAAMRRRENRERREEQRALKEERRAFFRSLAPFRKCAPERTLALAEAYGTAQFCRPLGYVHARPCGPTEDPEACACGCRMDDWFCAA